MRLATLLLCLCLAITSPLAAQFDKPIQEPESKVPEGLQYYMGREIALTMSFRGAPWLIRAKREKEERCSLVLANLGIRRGMNICDMGCGNGFYSLQMAKMVGPKGQIFGVDIQPEMLALLRKRMQQKGVENITPILGSVHDPRLPAGIIDLVLLVDVYHEFSHPRHMLAAMRRSLSPKGLIVLLEYREEDPKVPIKPLHKMSKAQIMKELPANGFKLVKEFDGLPWQHMMFFGRDENWKDEKKAEESEKSEEPQKDSADSDKKKANSPRSEAKTSG